MNMVFLLLYTPVSFKVRTEQMEVNFGARVYWEYNWAKKTRLKMGKERGEGMRWQGENDESCDKGGETRRCVYTRRIIPSKKP